MTICDTRYTLAVILPKSEFDKTVAINVTKIVLVCFLLVFTAVVLCVVFSRKFVAPVIKNLEKIRKQEHAEAKSDISEIDDLFVYLAEQDKLRDLETDKLKRQNDELASVTESQTAEIDRATSGNRTACVFAEKRDRPRRLRGVQNRTKRTYQNGKNRFRSLPSGQNR